MRKIIQIAAAGVENNAGTQCNAYVFALCDDGTLWSQRDNGNEWFQYPEIPQPETVPEKEKHVYSNALGDFIVAHSVEHATELYDALDPDGEHGGDERNRDFSAEPDDRPFSIQIDGSVRLKTMRQWAECYPVGFLCGESIL